MECTNEINTVLGAVHRFKLIYEATPKRYMCNRGKQAAATVTRIVSHKLDVSVQNCQYRFEFGH